ncbi:MAG: O-linked N-acetylglucosamine transferase, SPINDLY family protein [Pseudanabaena frigida]|uniref:O-linked N-acetylglucosamine transferase, SPINDLY family protein n=1 Tax=Pseudanabaena frigida TaxID=945775 RepID=A0A2W4WCE5_9CYAN|nr:MAG: O-linked N-acetylglucosamine transferase, SPINDLY family protein [Pseudanabaena frigida]
MDKAYELFNHGQYPDAATLYEEAIELEPDVKSHYWYLGLCLLFQGQLEDAQITWWITIDESDSSKNEFVEFLRKIATDIGLNLNRFDMAASILEAGIGLELENIYLLTDLARFYALSMRHAECIEVAKQYRELAQDLPNQVFANHLILHSLLSGGNQWQEIFALADSQIELLRLLIQENLTNLTSAERNRLFIATFFLPYIKDDPAKNRTLQNQLAKVCQNNLQSLSTFLPTESPKNNPEKRPLKIGYLSHCLRKHSVGWLSRWIFKHHNREQFNIHAYFLFDKPEGTDSVREFIAGHCDKSYKLGHDATAIAKQIQEDQIDILVDLDSITLDISCEVMALKPAHVQVTWLGLDASGIPTIDYFIADPYVLPENAQDYYSERIWRLPSTYIAVDSFEVLFPTIHRSHLHIPTDAVVYLSSQAGYKRHPDNIKLQMQIIKSVPNSYLLIKGLSEQEGIRNFFTDIAISEGINRDRLIFLPQVNTEAEHRANLAIADIILDTYPYNGATTTMEALWMCIPLVTRVGEQFAARNSYTMMINAGITEGIAWSDQEYIDWGIRLGRDESLRKQVFWKLKESRKTAPLWDAEKFTRDMESAYQQMWDIYVKPK